MGKQRSWFALSLAILSVILFVVMVPGAWDSWYKQGAGHVIGELIDLGLNLEAMDVEGVGRIARPFAIIHASLMVLVVFSVHVLFLVTVGTLATVTSTVVKRKLKIAFPFVCVFGGTCLGIGQGMVQADFRWYVYLASGYLIWLVIGTIVAVVGLIIARLRRPTEGLGAEDDAGFQGRRGWEKA